MMNRLLLPQVSYCQDWEGSLRASRANSCPPGKKPRTWWQQHGRIASCTSLINCFPWAAKLAWDKRQHRQHLIFPMRWLRFWHFATLHGLEDLPVLVIWVLLWSALFLSLMIATAAQRSRVFVPHLYCGLAGSSRTSRTIKPSFWILFDKASVFMDLCTGTTTAPLGDKCHKENGTNVSSQPASDPAGFRSQCYDQIRWFCHENWISVCCIHMSQFLSIFHGIVQTNACRPLALTCHHAQSIRQRNMMNRLLLPQVSYCQDWEGSLRASGANSFFRSRKSRKLWGLKPANPVGRQHHSKNISNVYFSVPVCLTMKNWNVPV